jgi:hypothetical protein
VHRRAASRRLAEGVFPARREGLRLGRVRARATAAICLLATSTTPYAASFAQGEVYKPNRKSTLPTREQLENTGHFGIIPHNQLSYAFIHDPKAEEGDLTLRADIPLQIHGCYEMYQTEIEQKIVGKTLVLDIEMPIATKPRSHNRNPDCKLTDSIGTNIHIDRDALLEKNVDQIKFVTKYGVLIRDMELTENYATLTAPGNDRIKPYTYWSLPANTVVLSVPMFNKDLMYHDTQLQQLARMAKVKGLTPIETRMPEYTPADDITNRFYFLDTKGDLLKKLKEKGGALSIGHIHIKEPFYGPNGLYDKEKGIDILASIPASRD